MLTNSVIGDIKYYLRHGNMVTRLILINVGVFFCVGIFYLLLFFAQQTDLFRHLSTSLGLSSIAPLKDVFNALLAYLELPASAHLLGKQPWTIFTYMFLHAEPLHILFNMLWLYWFGEIFILYLGDKKILPLYILGGIAGGITYMLAYNFLPPFKPAVNNSVLLGASASILAIAVGAATINPEHEVRLMFIGPVRIKYIVLFSLLLDAINIPYTNAGGYISHMGGALSGFLYIKILQSGYDIFSPFSWFSNLFRRKSGVKVSYRNIKGATTSTKNRGKDDQEKVDEILDKIARSGYDSLTREEKDFLFNYSKK